jgi:hypothetical protein
MIDDELVHADTLVEWQDAAHHDDVGMGFQPIERGVYLHHPYAALALLRECERSGVEVGVQYTTYDIDVIREDALQHE